MEKINNKFLNRIYVLFFNNCCAVYWFSYINKERFIGENIVKYLWKIFTKFVVAWSTG